jgi:HAE1 family hydrophobic/amphiphilic exporter-1
VTQPSVEVGFDYKGLTGEEFRKEYGQSLESGLRSLKRSGLRTEKVEADYGAASVRVSVLFNWNADSDEALKEVRAYVDAASVSMPADVRDSRTVWARGSQSKGFFLATVSSPQRSPTEVFELIDAQLRARTAALEDGTVRIVNPDNQQIILQLKPQKMASYGIYPESVRRTVENALAELSGGSVRMGQSEYQLMIPRVIQEITDLESLRIQTPSKGLIRLAEVADVVVARADRQLFKASGLRSVLLIARPKDGGNIKRLSEDLKTELQSFAKVLPADLKFNILVDPSIYIRESVSNVAREVAIGAGLAVVILFLFIGSLRNVMTAAIEIPLSLVLALILMKLFGMNLNLISLGGLALSSGMNVDASVVVLENIFRKFEGVSAGQLSAAQRLERIIEAVKEVIGPIVASTIASLVVFIPIVFTSDLTNAILGDLAKAVVFSHLFSAFVALLLVPTVRLHLMNRSKANQGVHAHRSPIEGLLTKLENAYEKLLSAFATHRWVIGTACAIICVVLAGLASVVLPKLPAEIIGKPDSDIVGIWSVTPKSTKMSQAESLFNDIEKKMLELLPQQCEFTYTEVYNPNAGILLCRLFNKKQMKLAMSRLQENFKSTPETQYETFQWSLAELPIPNPPDTLIEFSGGSKEQRVNTAADLSDALRGRFSKANFNASPSTEASNTVLMKPIEDIWLNPDFTELRTTPSALMQALRQYNKGESFASLRRGEKSIDIRMQTPHFSFSDLEELRGFPVAVGDKILPLRALFDFKNQRVIANSLYVNGESSLTIKGFLPDDQKKDAKTFQNEVQTFVERWKESRGTDDSVTIQFGQADREVRQAVQQLGVAAGWSVLLIFITMLLQFGSVVETLLVLVAVPLALIGVISSLFLFGSTLSVNSVLGVILLNGISVANSILLVDYAKNKFSEGLSAREAVVLAGKRRLRPILITSLTTILGMMPIALGSGEGGKVLQPLGIAVSGGLWISMLLTVFLVPALHGLYLTRLEKIRNNGESLA